MVSQSPPGRELRPAFRRTLAHNRHARILRRARSGRQGQVSRRLDPPRLARRRRHGHGSGHLEHALRRHARVSSARPHRLRAGIDPTLSGCRHWGVPPRTICRESSQAPCGSAHRRWSTDGRRYRRHALYRHGVDARCRDSHLQLADRRPLHSYRDRRLACRARARLQLSR